MTAPLRQTVELTEVDLGRHLLKRARSDEQWRGSLDRLTSMVSEVLDVPVAQVNVVTPDGQISVSSHAIPERASWGGWKEVGLHSSFCQHVVGRNERLVVRDAREHPLVRENDATVTGGIRSYAAVPIRDDSNTPFATLCVVGFDPRNWTDDDVATLEAVSKFAFREIGERVKAEVMLEQSELRFGALVEQTRELIVVLDSEGRAEMVTPACVPLLDRPSASITERAFSQLVAERDRPRWDAEFDWVLRRPDRRRQVEYQLLRADGTRTIVAGTMVNLTEVEAVGGVVLCVRDVTELRRFQHASVRSERMEALGSLAAGIAHDFNNVLSAIGTSAHVLNRMEGLPPDGQEDLDQIRSAVNRGSALSKQLMSFGRISQASEPEPVDASTIVSDMLPILRRLVRPEVTIDLQIEEGLPLLEIDPSQMQQLVMNLVVNAADATEHEGTVEVAVRGMTHEPGWVLEVRDSGTGIDSEIIDRIFEPYFTTKGDQGTGLGLGNVWRIANAYGGRVEVESEVGVGSKFSVFLPREPLEAGAGSKGR